MPEFSIITVCYNSGNSIKKTIESVLSQTFTDFEYIIVDGNSKDKTVVIAESYLDKFNGRLKIISEEDEGIYDAMNKGISLAKGKVIGLLNSDDFYFPNTLEYVANFYNTNKNKMVILSGSILMKYDNNINQPLYSSQKRFKKKIKQYKNPVRHPATFIPRQIYEVLGGFNLEYKISADMEFIYRAFQNNFKFKFVNDLLVAMTDGGLSNSSGIGQQMLREKRRFLKKYCKSNSKKIWHLFETFLRFYLLKRISPYFLRIYRKLI